MQILCVRTQQTSMHFHHHLLSSWKYWYICSMITDDKYYQEHFTDKDFSETPLQEWGLQTKLKKLWTASLNYTTKANKILKPCHDPDISKCKAPLWTQYVLCMHCFSKGSCIVSAILASQQFEPICFICEISSSCFTEIGSCSKFKRENVT